DCIKGIGPSVSPPPHQSDPAIPRPHTNRTQRFPNTDRTHRLEQSDRPIAPPSTCRTRAPPQNGAPAASIPPFPPLPQSETSFSNVKPHFFISEFILLLPSSSKTLHAIESVEMAKRHKARDVDRPELHIVNYLSNPDY
ncbi:hypothetical protein S83_011589, partial [Arachis hypogaea]